MRAALIQAWEKNFSIGGCWCYMKHMILFRWQFDGLSRAIQHHEDLKMKKIGNVYFYTFFPVSVCWCDAFLQQSKGVVCVICILSILWV